MRLSLISLPYHNTRRHATLGVVAFPDRGWVAHLPVPRLLSLSSLLYLLHFPSSLIKHYLFIPSRTRPWWPAHTDTHTDFPVPTYIYSPASRSIRAHFAYTRAIYRRPDSPGRGEIARAIRARAVRKYLLISGREGGGGEGFFRGNRYIYSSPGCSIFFRFLGRVFSDYFSTAALSEIRRFR